MGEQQFVSTRLHNFEYVYGNGTTFFKFGEQVEGFAGKSGVNPLKKTLTLFNCCVALIALILYYTVNTKRVFNVMFVDNIIPSPSLSEYIRMYRIIDFYFPVEQPLFPKLYTPRPEICLQFYPKDREKIQYRDDKEPRTGNSCSITGQHSVIQSRFVPKDFLSVQVVFKPGAFYRITGIPAALFTDAMIPADDVFGREPGLVSEQLLEAENYAQMIQAVEGFLLTLIKKVTIPCHTIGKVANLMIDDVKENTLDHFIKQAFMCQRQFDRKFYDLLGVSPKRFLRIIRFDKAFRMKNRFPNMDWLSVAVRCGYHDYQHLSKDYKEFTGLSPAQFFSFDNQGPDRLLGVAEV